MRLFKSGIAAICCVPALATMGCGFTASPAEGLQFAAPPGWQSSPGIMGFMQFWRPPVGNQEVLMLFKSPKPLNPKDVFSSGNMQGRFKSVTVRHETAIKICGGQPATLVAGMANSDKGDAVVDMVLTNVHGTSYLAMYVYPIDRAPNPVAMASLREVCAKT
jgi:hypothetical protein